MRPTKYLRDWSRRDRGLAEGLLAYEASLNEIGLPPHIARDPDREWGIDEVVDGAMAALDAANEQARKGPGLGHGVRLVVVDQGVREGQ